MTLSPPRRAFLVDTVASVVFFTAVATFSELIIAGLSPGQVLASRLGAIPAMIITGRPYGMWRDALFRRFPPRGRIGTAVLDTVAFMSFQVPVYFAILWVVGATAEQMAAAVGSAMVFMVVLSRPFGIYLDAVRRFAGVPTAHENATTRQL